MISFDKVVIDGDQMMYACGFAAEGEPLSHALHLVKKKVAEIQAASKAKSYELYIKGKGNFRDDIAPEYKGTRSARKPSHFEEIKRYMIEVLGAELVDGIEADDKVSILLYQDFLESEGDPSISRVVCASPDKDLLNTPGWHYNPNKGGLFWVSELQAIRHFCYQLLMGDSVDNIKGLPYVPNEIKDAYGLKSNKVGAATARALMQFPSSEQESLAFVIFLYLFWGSEALEYAGDAMDYFMEQARLLWMLRGDDEHFTREAFDDEFNLGIRWYETAVESSKFPFLR